MTDRDTDVKIAEWAGWDALRKYKDGEWGGRSSEGVYTYVPLYKTSDASAITLLLVLADRGYCPTLVYDDNGNWALSLEGVQSTMSSEEPTSVTLSAFIHADQWKPTIAEAIVYTILSLDREGV